jgi:hypothetical protein
MLGGIVFQLVAITVYVCLAAEFIVRYTADGPVRSRRNTSTIRGVLIPRRKLLLAAFALNTLCLFVRYAGLSLLSI